MSTVTRVEDLSFTAPPVVAAWRGRALIVGGLAAVLAIIGFIVNPAQAMHSYLLAYMWCLGLTLGSLVWLMVWHLTGGAWGVGLRRMLEAAMRTLPMMAVLFIPIPLTLKLNYRWAHPEEIAHQPHLQSLVSHYLGARWFVLRAILYFVAWGVLAWYLGRWSDEQDRPPDRLVGRFRAVSGVGLVIYGWTITFAVIDWVMSLQAPWPSSIYGLIFMIGQVMAALAFMTVLARLLRQYEPLALLMEPRHFHEWGKFLLMAVMVWGWFNYSQWLVIWSGNLPEEIHWYLARIHGGWGAVAMVLVVGQFAVPFALLLSRGLKRNPNTMAAIAGWLFLMRYVDLYWNISPVWSPERFRYHWMDAVIPAAMLGLWITYFLWHYGRRPVAALHDPHLRATLEGEHHG